MKDITYNKDDMLTVSSRNEIFDISMYKSKENLKSIEEFVKFVKACEKLVRSSNEYTHYKAQLMQIGLDRCQVLGNIQSDEDGAVTIEMHHGPILTLFDYCAIIIDYYLNHNEKINTFKIARTVINEHYEGNIQTVMLSKTVHQLVDSGELFINFNQATGNINRFLEKYHDGLNDERIDKINRYIDLCEKYDTFDNGLLNLKNTITNWNYDIAKKRMNKK